MTINSIRVYGSMLPYLLERKICIVGKVVNVDKGKIILESTDGISVNIRGTHFECEVGEMIEVVGVSKNGGVEANEIICLDNEVWDNFDKNNYDMTIKVASNEDYYLQNDDC